MNDIWEKAESLLELGKEESFKKNYIGAIKHFEEAQKQFLQCKDSLKIASCLAELALAHYNNNKDRLIRCLTLLNDARSLIDGLENKNYTEANILRYYGIIYYSERRYSESIRYYRNAQRLVEKNSLEYARTLDCLAVFYLRNNDYQVSNKYLKESLKLKIESQNKREILITKLLYGRFLASAENYDEAQSYFKDVLDELSRYGENATTARVQDELAKIYLALQNYEEAENLCVKSIELAQKLDKSLLKAFSYCTLAHLRIIKGNANEALEILKLEVKPIFAKETSVRGFGLLKRLQSLAYYALGDMKQAIEKSHEAIELFKEAGVSIDIVKSYFELSKIYKKADDVSMSMTCLLESLKIARINNDTLWAKKVEDFIFEIDEHEWASIVNKVAQKSSKAPETKPLLDTLTLIGDIAKPDVNLRDPLLSLLKIGRSIAAETSLDKLLEIIAEETKVALNADRCTVFLLDKESNELWSKVALGMGKQEIRFPANMGLAGHVASTGETINITDAYNDPRFNKEIDKKTGYTTKTILCMPMRNLSHDIIGVFQVLNKAGNKVFNDSDEDLLVAIGSSAGIALENASLFKKQQQMYDELKRSFISSINTLAAAIDARDKITSGHSTRVTGYAITIAKQLGMSEDDIEVLEYAALLHDFGKMGIKDNVLCKEGKLTAEEYKHIQEHAYITYKILKNMRFSDKFKEVPEIASSHHEKYNGSGYFRGLKGEEIPYGGRILAIADVFDAITSKRHYRDRMPFLQVLNILRSDSGSHFDGSIVDEFFKLTLDKILKQMLCKYDTPLTVAETLMFSKITLEDFHQILLKNETDRSEEDNKLIKIFEKHYNPKLDDEFDALLN